MKSSLTYSIFLLLLSLPTLAQSPDYNLVLPKARTIDPETRLDAIRNIGINNNRIVQISSEQLKGKQVINAASLVVTPGFIDLHLHGRSNADILEPYGMKH